MTDPQVHVLIVEDSFLIADAMRILFSERGYRVSMAHTLEAAQLAAAVPVDVLLLDLTLPDGDGLELLDRLEAAGLSRPRRVIALTGHGDAAAASRCMDAGCEMVLLKPVSIRELLRIVEAG